MPFSYIVHIVTYKNTYHPSLSSPLLKADLSMTSKSKPFWTSCLILLFLQQMQFLSEQHIFLSLVYLNTCTLPTDRRLMLCKLKYEKWWSGWREGSQCLFPISHHRQLIVKLHREKIRTIKALLEFSLATAIKDNKRLFYIYIRNKKRCKETLHFVSTILANLGDSSWLKVIKCDSHLQERLEGGSGQLQVCQSDLCGREGHGRDHLEGYHNPGIRLRQKWFMKGRSCSTNPISFYDKGPCSVDDKKTVTTWTLLKPLIQLWSAGM